MSIDLSKHIAALQAKANVTNSEHKLATDARILLLATPADTQYLQYLKPCARSSTVVVKSAAGNVTKTEIQLFCKQRNINKVLTTSVHFLRTLLMWTEKRAPTLDSYAGSYFTIPCLDNPAESIEIVFIPPLKQLVTVPYGKYLTTRYITKLTTPEVWFKPSKFTGFTMITPDTLEATIAKLRSCFLVSVDIETFKENAVIRCLSYTGFSIDAAGTLESFSYVLALDSEYALAMMRRLNSEEVPAGKVMQNGMYDAAYFCRYSAPLHNYLYDTANMFHCWLAELPKNLGFLNAFLVREAMYWKDLSNTNDLHEYYRYNALDTWGTGNAFLAMLAEIPSYAFNNYLLEFPLVFPSHMCEMTGIKRDMNAMESARKEQQAVVDKHTASLNAMLDIPKGESMNVMSPPQMKSLIKILGCADLGSTDEKNLKKVRFRHPFNARIVNSILKVRKARKLISTYITAGKEFSYLGKDTERVLYSLRPHGTDTGRQASSEHAFWCGINIQNIPRGKVVKQTFVADDGFHMCEVDLEQAESRDTAYISGDETLITNVEYSPDFHCANASAFFGIPFEELFDIITGKVINKPIRQLGKPVNHGANYNMGSYVLIDTMGEENIVLAKQLLQLPKSWGYKDVAEHLLAGFHKTYPKIKGTFYKGVVAEVSATGMIASQAVHWKWEDTTLLTEEYKATLDSKWSQYEGKAWTRKTFSNPLESKQALNAYIAHPPQSLNANTLNKAFLSVFKDIAINPKYSNNFKLYAQIHDSILFAYRAGHEYLIQMVQDRMQIPVTVKAYDGKVRTFVVPAGAKCGKHLEKGFAKYWSETE
jgi:DNA polymerase I-like protein with 3'-5' exonuclease and polymerase domains